MKIGIQIVCAQDQLARVPVSQVARDGFEKGDLKRLANIIDTKAVPRTIARIGKAARRMSVSKWIRKLIEKNMVLDAASRGLSRFKCGERRR
jgi:hypothetical protein